MTLYKHIKTNKLYKVIGIGRNVKTLEETVIYKQCYSSKLYGTEIILPKNSIWTRNLYDFEKKFKKV